ncbi:hypothetical protein L218DRAFT_926972 [Marasmius fiardii PR-910]|nr:hypothetical protein L218DRAFT_926972 [Marasmius fiardii PR-910]
MRFTPLYCYVLAVVVGTVTASPLPVPEAEDSNPLAHVRFGHAMGSRDLGPLDATKPNIMITSVERLNFQPVPGRPPRLPEGAFAFAPEQVARPCAGAGAHRRLRLFKIKFQQKSIEISNIFREALGMPLIKSDKGAVSLSAVPVHPRPITYTKVHNVDVPRGGRGGIFYDRPTDDNGLWTVRQVFKNEFDARKAFRKQVMEQHKQGHHGGHHGRGGHHRVHGLGHHQMGGRFMVRLHYALMSLGPWEGRAVAFVLGCGIGVLIRMIWVLAVITYRAVKGGNNQEEDETDGYLRLEGALDAEEIFVAPPQYVVDEKVPVVADDAKN